VVDDDSDIRLLYTCALTHPGCHVDAAADGDAGWEALQANRYNLMITEYAMPKLTGIELVRKLRAARMAMPVVMAAGRLPTWELAQDPSLQLAAVLPKPFYISELLATVRAVLYATNSPGEPVAPPTWRDQPRTIDLRF
jgi:DNA-binding response OmpR family regulator